METYGQASEDAVTEAQRGGGERSHTKRLQSRPQGLGQYRDRPRGIYICDELCAGIDKFLPAPVGVLVAGNSKGHGRCGELRGIIDSAALKGEMEVRTSPFLVG